MPTSRIAFVATAVAAFLLFSGCSDSDRQSDADMLEAAVATVVAEALAESEATTEENDVVASEREEHTEAADFTVDPAETATADASTPTPSPMAKETAESLVIDEIDSDWLHYENPALGYSLRYPRGWVKYASPDGSVTLASVEMLGASGIQLPQAEMYVSIVPAVSGVVGNSTSSVTVGYAGYDGQLLIATEAGETSIRVLYQVASIPWLISLRYGGEITLDHPASELFLQMVATITHDASAEVTARAEAQVSIVPLSPEYLNPESSIRVAIRDIFGEGGCYSCRRMLEDNRPYEIRAMYHIATAEVGEFNADTTDFYPWLVDYIRSGTTTAEFEPSTQYISDRLELREHFIAQTRTALNNPGSELAWRLRQMEAGLDPVFPEYGTEVYWWYLIGPRSQVLSSSAQSSMQKGFLRVQQEYEDAVVFRATDADFVTFLRDSRFYEIWFED